MQIHKTCMYKGRNGNDLLSYNYADNEKFLNIDHVLAVGS